MAPIFDADFSPFSYGFRPGRNAHQALRQAKDYINEGYQDIIDLDLKSFFDEVDHDLLMELLKRKVKDPILLTLIHRFVRSGLPRATFRYPIPRRRFATVGQPGEDEYLSPGKVRAAGLWLRPDLSKGSIT